MVFQLSRMLLDAGANPNLHDTAGKSALDYALERRAPKQIIDLLVSKGAKRGEEVEQRPVFSEITYRKLGLKVGATPQEILGVTPNASQEEIKKAWRIKSLQWHPDKNKDSEASNVYKLINSAYEQLKQQ